MNVRRGDVVLVQYPFASGGRSSARSCGSVTDPERASVASASRDAVTGGAPS